MVMFGLHFTGREPFHTVHLTGLVRDAEGQKMSKTRGNVLDPADLVAEYGSDALRFTLTILDIPGRDIPLDPERMAGYRAFGNKIWNATRFALSRASAGDRVRPDLAAADLAVPERWILSRLSTTAAEVNARFAEYRFDEAANRLYHFFWGDLCDWYIELVKPALSGEAPRPAAGEVLLTVLERSLRLLHPVMPFLTEELWQRLPGREAVHPETITLAPYPERVPAWDDPVTERLMGVLIEVVSRVRALVADPELRGGETADLFLDAEDPALAAFLGEHLPLIERLTRTVATARRDEVPGGAVWDVVAGAKLALWRPARELGEEERQRLGRELEKIESEIAGAAARLANEQFLAKAPREVVAGNRLRLNELQERARGIRATLFQEA
jgi:valyl-tRNA synthetase